MDELLTGVALDPIKFTKILSVLARYSPNLSYLAKEMRTDFGSYNKYYGIHLRA